MGAFIKNKDEIDDWLFQHAQTQGHVCSSVKGLVGGKLANVAWVDQITQESITIEYGNPTRTDQEIVNQTNELARRFARLQGCEEPEGHKFHEDGGDRMPCPWLLACIAQEFLAGVDPDDALSNLGE